MEDLIETKDAFDAFLAIRGEHCKLEKGIAFFFLGEFEHDAIGCDQTAQVELEPPIAPRIPGSGFPIGCFTTRSAVDKIGHIAPVGTGLESIL